MLFGCLAIWLFGYLAVWLFGCLAVWLFGCLAVWPKTSDSKVERAETERRRGNEGKLLTGKRMWKIYPPFVSIYHFEKQSSCTEIMN